MGYRVEIETPEKWKKFVELMSDKLLWSGGRELGEWKPPVPCAIYVSDDKTLTYGEVEFCWSEYENLTFEAFVKVFSPEEQPEPTKKELLQALAVVLRLTGRGVVDLELVDNDTVKIHFEGNNSRLVNVAMDSHIAIIRDVAKNIG